MRVVFLSHFYSPEIGPAVKRISGLARHLKELGHQVDIVTGFPNYPSGRKEKGYNRRFYMKDNIDGIRVYRYYVYSSPKKNGLNRMLNYISFMISSLLFIFNRNKYDVIIVSSPPLLLGISGYFISRFRRIPLIFDIRDLWPDISVEMGELSQKALMYKTLNSLANFLYRKSTLITVVTQGKKDKLICKGIDHKKIKVVSNGFDVEFLENRLDEQLIKKHRLMENFILTYAGIIGLAQGLGVIIEAAEKLKKYTNISFIFIGDGVEREKLEMHVKKLQLNNVKFIGLQAHEKIYTFLKYSAVSIVPLKNENLQDSVPSKLLEAMGVGCPVILSAKGESAGLLNQAKGGIVVKPGDSKALVDAILYIYNHSEKRVEMGKNGQEFILNNFTRKSIAQKLNDILQGL